MFSTDVTRQFLVSIAECMNVMTCTSSIFDRKEPGIIRKGNAQRSGVYLTN